MSTNWIVPRRVSRILSNFTVELEHPLTGTSAVVHICRIKRYADASVGTKAQIKEVAEFTDRIWYSSGGTAGISRWYPAGQAGRLMDACPLHHCCYWLTFLIASGCIRSFNVI